MITWPVGRPDECPCVATSIGFRQARGRDSSKYQASPFVQESVRVGDRDALPAHGHISKEETSWSALIRELIDERFSLANQIAATVLVSLSDRGLMP